MYRFPVDFIRTVYVECEITDEIFDNEIIELCSAPTFNEIFDEGWTDIVVGKPDLVEVSDENV